MDTTVTPTYEEGIRRGATDASKLAEETRLADVFSRDETTARIMRDNAIAIRYGLAHVGSCDAEYEAMRHAKDLVAALDRLVDHFNTVTTEHRAAAAALREGR